MNKKMTEKLWYTVNTKNQFANYSASTAIAVLGEAGQEYIAYEPQKAKKVKCEYCGNKSGITDARGQCVSCGAPHE